MDILHEIVKNTEDKAHDFAFSEVYFESGSYYYFYFTIVLFHGLNN